MLSKKQKQQEKDSDLETNRSEDSELLDTSIFSSACTSKTKSPVKRLTLKKSQYIEHSSSDQEDWKTQYTRSIRKQQSPRNQQAPQKQTNFKRKYPKEFTNYKAGTVEVKRKDNTNAKYENLCSICLDKYSSIRGQLGCGHKFCYECIHEWIRTSTKCPCCRENFRQYVRITVTDKDVEKKREIIEVEEKIMEFNELDYYICYSCDRGDDEDVLLVCDMCQFYCCHVYCDHSLRNIFPDGQWYCKNCKQTLKISQKEPRQNNKAPKKDSKKQTKKPSNKTKRPAYTDNQSDDESDQNKVRVTRSSSNLEVNFSTRSKAFEIINLRPSPTTNNFSTEMERISNSTAVNLRNLRRRRIS